MGKEFTQPVRMSMRKKLKKKKMTKKINKKLKPIQDANENIRAFVDLKAIGAAEGGMFFRNDLVEHIKKIEADGTKRVVGVVYDETYDLEILTQTIKNNNLVELNSQ